ELVWASGGKRGCIIRNIASTLSCGASRAAKPSNTSQSIGSPVVSVAWGEYHHFNGVCACAAPMSENIVAQAWTATNLLVALAMTLDSSTLLTDQQALPEFE